MGFMAGFGEGFSQSFGEGMERRARRKEDMFKMTYQNYLSRLEEYNKKKEETSKGVKLAKSYAKDLAGNEEAWPKVYEWVAAGWSQSQIEDAIKNGEFEITGTPDPASPDATPVVDQQMADAGLAEPEAPQMPQEEKGPLGKLLGDSPFKKNDFSDSVSSVAEAAGQSPEQVQSVLGGSQPKFEIPSGSGIVYREKPKEIKFDEYNTDQELAIQVADAQRKYRENPTAENEVNLQIMQDRLKAVHALEEEKILKKINVENAAKGIVGANSARVKIPDEDGNGFQVINIIEKNGQWVTVANEKPVDLDSVVRISEEEQKAVDQIRREFTTKTDKHQPKINAALDLVRVGKSAADIVAASGGKATARRTGAFAELAQDWANELVTIQSLVESDSDTSQINDELDNIDRQIDGMISQGVNDLATYNKLLEAKLKVFSYKLGIAMGQEGRALAETERKIFDEMANAAGSPDKFNQNLALLIKDQVASVDQASKDMFDLDATIKGFQKDWGWSPVEPIPSLPKMMAKDENLKQAWEFFKPYMNINPRPSTNQSSQSLPTQIPNGAIELLKANPNLAEQFNKKYGQGQAEKILGGQ